MDNNNNKKTIVYVDGVFDIMHSGHFNAIRQANTLGDHLLVGVNCDEDVFKSKGPTLMNTSERAALAGACKWSDEIIKGTPYTADIPFLDKIGANFAAHGDDISTNEKGEDCYSELKQKGRMKTFKRTEGVSSTELLGRLLKVALIEDKDNKDNKDSNDLDKVNEQPIVSKFLTTGMRLKDFCNNKTPKEGQKVIYIDGSWDILHFGHIKILEEAKAKGDFLYVGIYNDKDVTTLYGSNFPIVNLQERVLNLLAMKYVDDVIIGAPLIINKDMITSINIDMVYTTKENDSKKVTINNQEIDRYKDVKEINKFGLLDTEEGLSSKFLIDRIIKQKEYFINKYNVRSKKELNYYQNQKVSVKEL